MGEKKIEKLLSTNDIMDIFGVSREYLKKARANKGLPYYNIGGIKYKLSEIERWMRERKKNG